MSYSILAYDDDDSSPTCTAHYIKNIKDKHTLVDTIFNLVTTKIEDKIVNYEIQFRGHVYFQAVRPQFVISALNWLVANNPLYRNIEIQCDNISSDLTNLNCPDTDQENIDEALQLQSNVNRELCNEDVKEQDDPLNEHRSAASETCLQSILPNYPVNLDNTNCNSTGREVFNIAPCEGKHPVSLMTDKLCEELSFPVLFPKGRFGYSSERDIKLSPIKYFNARLLHYSGKFATNPEYLFFAQFIMEQKKISDSINIAHDVSVLV